MNRFLNSVVLNNIWVDCSCISFLFKFLEVRILLINLEHRRKIKNIDNFVCFWILQVIGLILCMIKLNKYVVKLTIVKSRIESQNRVIDPIVEISKYLLIWYWRLEKIKRIIFGIYLYLYVYTCVHYMI